MFTDILILHIVCNFAMDFFVSGILSTGVNGTLLTLVPKVQYPEYLFHLRLINLCNVGYKIITKTVTNKLKEKMSSVVAPSQSSFVPGRQIVDNIIIYQEVLHSMRKRKIGKGLMTIKIDLEKAYDRISWSFIRETLEWFKLPGDWIRNIMHCIEWFKLPETMSIPWNGRKLDSFRPTRGNRQGDAISLYIFVLCMERLGHIINQAFRSVETNPTISNRASTLSSFLYR